MENILNYWKRNSRQDFGTMTLPLFHRWLKAGWPTFTFLLQTKHQEIWSNANISQGAEGESREVVNFTRCDQFQRRTHGAIHQTPGDEISARTERDSAGITRADALAWKCRWHRGQHSHNVIVKCPTPVCQKDIIYRNITLYSLRHLITP